VALSRDPAARRRLAALGLIAAAAATAGVVAGSQAGDETSAAPPPAPSERAQRDARQLSLRKQVGLVLVSSFDGPRARAYLRRRLRQGTLAGVVLFRDNITTPEGLKALTRSLQRAAGGDALVMVDQEGGSVRRIPFAAPAPAQGAFTTPARAGRSARRAAQSLRRVGVNVNLAPVADLPEGPVMRPRAYGGEPRTVARLVSAAVTAYRKAGFGATAKHFPGFGAARVNTDDGEVTIARSRSTLEGRDLLPFKAAIRAGVPLVMASHALYPALDPRRITSQSPKLLRGLLRRELGFGGAIVTDSIEAEAVLRRSSVAIAAERSIAAGADQVLMSGSASWKFVFPHLLDRARRSRAFRSRLEEAAARVLDLKRRLRLG
jgi:beta-N-acetylhexosaminidase